MACVRHLAEPRNRPAHSRRECAATRLPNERPTGHVIGRLAQSITTEGLATFVTARPDVNLSHTHWAVLNSIDAGSGGTCASVASDIGHDVGATSRTLRVLEERGLVLRRRSTEDRRVVSLSLSPAGRELATVCRMAWDERWNELLTDWSDADVDLLTDLMHRLLRTLRCGGQGKSDASAAIRDAVE